jgi:Predicted exosome subunit/U3 small nucleolar ribonucleoprotein (snoRNP) component, contains IMP4 domain
MEGGLAGAQLAAKILATTSRFYSKKINEFLNELSTALPGVEKVVRGKRSYRALLEEAVARGADYIALVRSRRGNPASLEFIDVARRRWLPYSIPISRREDARGSPGICGPESPKARRAAIVDYTASELADVFLEIFRYPLFYSIDLEEVRGRYDTLLLIRGKPGGYSLELSTEGIWGRGALLLKLRE